MIVILKQLVYEKLIPDLERLNVIEKEGDKEDRDRYKGHGRHKRDRYSHDGCEIDLSSLTKKECENLEKLLRECGVHGSRIAAADVEKYLRASKNGIETVRARTCRQAAWMLEHFFANLPHHMIFSKDEYGGHSHSGYYVGDVDYEPEKVGDRYDRRQPEY